ncbi:MAG: DoxX family protein [Acidobacteriota bacterium]|nr:DoxX family protein [Acidobacteriota bacterium]
MPATSLRRTKTGSRYVLGVLFILAGANHLRNPALYVAIMPPYLPWHLALVYISGAAQITLGALLLWRRWSAVAAWGLIALLAAIFPANLHMALHPERYRSVPEFALWLRLPLQGVLMLWAWWYARGKGAGDGECTSRR